MTYERVHQTQSKKNKKKVSLLSHHQPLNGLYFLKAYFKYYLSISTIVLGNDSNSNLKIAITDKCAMQCITILTLHLFLAKYDCYDIYPIFIKID